VDPSLADWARDQPPPTPTPFHNVRFTGDAQVRAGHKPLGVQAIHLRPSGSAVAARATGFLAGSRAVDDRATPPLSMAAENPPTTATASASRMVSSPSADVTPSPPFRLGCQPRSIRLPRRGVQGFSARRPRRNEEARSRGSKTLAPQRPRAAARARRVPPVRTAPRGRATQGEGNRSGATRHVRLARQAAPSERGVRLLDGHARELRVLLSRRPNVRQIDKQTPPGDRRPLESVISPIRISRSLRRLCLQRRRVNRSSSSRLVSIARLTSPKTRHAVHRDAATLSSNRGFV
jgi:hypothetical protein